MKKILVIISLSLLSSCTSRLRLPENYENSELFFRHAQSFTYTRKYKEAIAVYNYILLRFPDEILAQIRAEFNIAQIYFERKKNLKALEHYNNVLRAYAVPLGSSIPKNYKILVLKNIKTIEDKLQKN